MFWKTSEKLCRVAARCSTTALRRVQAQDDEPILGQSATNITGTVEDRQNGWMDPWISHLLLVRITNVDGSRV
jgi:hypothetical protein